MTEDSIRNPYLKAKIDRTKKLIYDGEGEKVLSDIISSINLIENFIRDLKSFAEYEKDLKTKVLLKDIWELSGEAVNEFLKMSDANELKSTSQIISLRNRLIYSYDSIDDSIIWSILTRHLLPLKDTAIT